MFFRIYIFLYKSEATDILFLPYMKAPKIEYLYLKKNKKKIKSLFTVVSLL